jgi:glycosyltransferase involved in cell wall biosynthesis
VPRFLFAADLLVHPAYSETTGTVLVEAIAAGLPSIVTDVCGYAFHVARAKAGIVIASPFQQEAFNQALHDLLTKKDRLQLSQNGIEYCQQNLLFDMPNSVVDLLEEKIITNKLQSRNQLKRYLLDDKNFKDILKMNGDVYRALEGRRTLRFEIGNQGYFAKIHQGVGVREIIKNLLQGRFPVVGALCEYKAILRLKQLNIKTMTVVAFAQRGINPATLKSFIVTDELSNTVSLEHYGKSWKQTPPDYLLKLAFTKKIANIARVLHSNGVNHRDFYAAHLLLDISQGENCITHENLKIYLIDLHRMQIRKQVPLRWVVKDIAALYYSVMDFGLSHKDLLRFIKLYQGKSLRRALVEDRYFWKKVIKQGIYLYHKAHKTTPVLSDRVLQFANL